MKNIHILPIDKPSRLWINNLLQDKLELSKEALPYNTSRNIYITSDEEIKEGDWFIDDNNSIFQSYKLLHVKFANPKKIILTTDFDKQPRVQAIDDEFLEWFVENPSCEWIEVFKSPKQQLSSNYYSTINWIDNNAYKIIIPKEEPKQETTSEGFYRISKEIDYTEFDFISFKIGVEWQQERSYSEEEAKKLIELHSDFIYSKIDYEGINNATTAISCPEWNDEEWFEQFKKK